MTAPIPDRLARARALRGNGKADTELADSRIRFIMDALANGAWQPGVVDVGCAEIWNVSLSSVRAMASEAARHVRLGLGEKTENVRDTLVARVDSIVRSALGRRRAYMKRDGSVVEVLDPDHASALKGCELLGKLFGIFAEQAEKTDGPGVTTRLPKDELVRRLMDGLLADPEHRHELQRRLSLVTDAADAEPKVSHALLPTTTSRAPQGVPPSEGT